MATAKPEETYASFVCHLQRIAAKWTESTKVHTFYDFYELMLKEQIYQVVLVEYATLMKAQRPRFAQELDETAASSQFIAIPVFAASLFIPDNCLAITR